MPQMWGDYDPRIGLAVQQRMSHCKAQQGLSNKGGQEMEVNEMEQREREMQCAICGYTASGKFVGDICPDCGLTYWKWHNCGYTITAAGLPGVCPECYEKYDFLSITCYTPECGGPGHIDPWL